ncbi:MAG: hypothetical protein RSA29_18575 [Clostridium sp.]|uniref:hypothetical protein n=1 Tax=Clostridium sp. TaxID=1506 RepID=UPI00302425FD
MRTERDVNILRFVEAHGSITISQCSNMFFYKNIYGYDQARKRLSNLKKEGFIKRYRKDPRTESVYYIEKPLKIHDLKLLDVYTKIYNSFEITFYKRELKLDIPDKLFKQLNKSYIIDAAMSIERKVPLLIEIDYTHYTSLDKIKEVVQFYENKNNRRHVFIVVKFTQIEIQKFKVCDMSDLYFVPWNLEGLSDILTSLRSDIDNNEYS